MQEKLILLSNLREKKSEYDYLAFSHKISQSGDLLRISNYNTLDMQYMGITADFKDDTKLNAELITDIVIREAKLKGVKGIVADIRESNYASRQLLQLLDTACPKENINFFVPAISGMGLENAIIIIETSVTGGSLEELFYEYINSVGSKDRVAAEIVLLCIDYKLPVDRYTEYEELTYTDAMRRCDENGSSIFFSKDLASKYYTYVDSSGNPHYVIVDDIDTVNYKVEFIKNLGIRHIFAIQSDIEGK